MTESELKVRTKSFALRILDLAEALPKTRAGDVVANQIIRSGTSVGANYRALCRSKSRADFANKCSVIEEEADETAFWLEITGERRLVPSDRIQSLLQEANELTAIFVSSRKTARAQRSPEIENRKSKIENH